MGAATDALPPPLDAQVKAMEPAWLGTRSIPANMLEILTQDLAQLTPRPRWASEST